MVQLLSALGNEDGARASLVEGVALLRATKSCVPVPVLYEPCVVVVAQGQKRFHVPDGVLTYDARNYLVVTVPVPADCETTVAPEGPFMGFAVRIDLQVLGDLLMKMGQAPPVDDLPQCEVRVSAPPMNAALSNVCVRLAETFASASEAKAMGPQFVREFLYRVLCGPAGGALRSLLLGSESRIQIHRVLERMHLDYAAPLDLSTLAHDAGMSSSSLHFHFKAVTAASPVQYLKTLRLHKARMLMVQTSVSAAVAAQRVGYVSPSQFSREFKRLFGAPPADEAQRVRTAFGFTDEVSASGSASRYEAT